MVRRTILLWLDELGGADKISLCVEHDVYDVVLVVQLQISWAQFLDISHVLLSPMTLYLVSIVCNAQQIHRAHVSLEYLTPPKAFPWHVNIFKERP